MGAIGVTPDDVWNAYKALYRYAVETNQEWKIARRDVAPFPPTPLYRSRTALLAALLTQLYDELPLDVDREYYAYLFLFTQWRRINYANGATYISFEKGWKKLDWYGFIALSGPIHKTEKTWRQYHKKLATWEVTTISVMYPWLDELGSWDKLHMIRDARFLKQRALSQNEDIYDVVKLARAEHGLSRHWHPWVHLAYGDMNLEAIMEFSKMMNHAYLWKAFLEGCEEVFKDVARKGWRARLLAQLDEYVRYGGGTWAPTWRTRRKALLPMKGVR